MIIDFSEKTAVVTGGTRGIGRSITSLLIESGCRVIYTGTKDEPDNPIEGGIYEQLDLSEITGIERFEKEVIDETPDLDILINNAGVNIIEPIDEIQDKHWEKLVTVNLTGTMRMTREAAKVMKKNDRRGKILNISSIFGVISKEKRDSYSASKAGVIGLTRASALDLAPYGILVNALCPGFTLTELTSTILSKKEIETMAKNVPLGRFAEVSEIARTALFLCSDLNTYITGQTILVDGGVTVI